MSDPESSHYPEILHFGTTPEFEEPVWWGVTSGSLAYAAQGKNAEEAQANVAAAIGITPDRLITVPTFVHPHEDDYQPVLCERYADRQAVRVIPFSMVEWPSDLNNMTDEQTAACERVWGPRPHSTEEI